MSMHDLIRSLKDSNKTKIVMLVADGLGGLPIAPGGQTELETARTPNLDRLATEGTVGEAWPGATQRVRSSLSAVPSGLNARFAVSQP